MRKYLKYKGVPVNALGLPIFNPNKKEIHKSEPKRFYSFHKCFDFNFGSSSPKDLLVIYDIPFEKRKERDWFRRHLQKFDYVMVQKSVWVGPSPLPKDFLNYVKSIGLSKQLKTFKLATPYI
ncbi:MAG: CRISPR-associated endonuclease Cas2 [Candidatus Taylorbacteria bacterium]|nr:CRISPR-associated endonuclease Cas2 [Candidatus Taylorbacteria bacterium]